MSCGIIDFACHFGSAAAPIFAFINAWAWLGWFVAGLIIGGVLGWRPVLAVLTLGIGYLLYERFKKAPEPDFETGEPDPPAKPKKRKSIF
jgi:hypothetical protein